MMIQNFKSKILGESISKIDDEWCYVCGECNPNGYIHRKDSYYGLPRDILACDFCEKGWIVLNFSDEIEVLDELVEAGLEKMEVGE